MVQSARYWPAQNLSYEDAAKQINGEQEVHARHILLETEDQARAIAKKLKKGADFAELAKNESKDPRASDGGDLGFFTKDQMLEISNVAFALETLQKTRFCVRNFLLHGVRMARLRFIDFSITGSSR
jgi:parvulin-like peptidyl-prolyl isomerase